MSVDYRPNYDPADVDHDYGHTGGDITVPTFQGNTKPFRFWCQKALPLVYDDSLSYYEVLCKMADYLNNFMTDLTTVEDSMTEFGQQFVLNQQFLNSMADQLGQNVADLEAYINDRMEDFMTAYTQLQTYVNTYFDNLDVQAEINNKLDTMASDGTLNDLFDPVLETWMQQKTAQIDAAIAGQNAVQAAQNGRISVLEGRMDTFDGLPAGSTAGNAELIGIRTNFLGEVYPTAGDAVRSSDMIASGFESIPFTRLEEWNGNEAASVYDTLQIDVSAYKGGRVIMIANMEGFESAVVGIGVGVYATNVSGKTVDQDAHAYILGSNVFVNYSVIPTDISGEERIALYFNIPDNFSYQYLKMGFVEPIPIQDYTQPAAIVYATSWSKTKVDPTLTNAGEAADAKATGDALDELNERMDEQPIAIKTFIIKAGQSHSSQYDKLYTNIKAGEDYIIVWKNASQAFIAYGDGTYTSTTKSPITGTAEKDIVSIGLYKGASSSDVKASIIVFKNPVGYDLYESLGEVDEHEKYLEVLKHTVAGKNLVDSVIDVYFPVFIKAGEHVTWAYKEKSVLVGNEFFLYFYDKDKQYIAYYGSTDTSGKTSRTVTPSSTTDAYYIRLTGTLTDKLQVELGDTATDYEPYIPNNLILSDEIKVQDKYLSKNVTFSVTAGSSHSSTKDKVPFELATGDGYGVFVKSDVDRSVELYEYNGGTPTSKGLIRTNRFYMFTSATGATDLSLYVNSGSTNATFTLIVWRVDSINGVLIDAISDLTLADTGARTVKFSVNAGSTHSSLSEHIEMTVEEGGYFYCIAMGLQGRDASVFMRNDETQSSVSLTDGIIARVKAPFDVKRIGLYVGTGTEKVNISFSAFTDKSIFAGLNEITERDNLYFTKLLNAKRKANPGNYSNQTSPEIFTLAHFSDIHGNAWAMEQVQKFKDTYQAQLDDVICTGDVVSDKIADGTDFWDDNSDGEILICIGNHDSLGSNGWANPVDQQTLYETYIAPYEDNWGAETVSGHSYWYKDYSDKKIRLIAIDATIYDATEQASQMTWLNAALSGAITNGYAVVGAIHFPPMPANFHKVDSNFTALLHGTAGDMSQFAWHTYHTDILEAVDQFIDDGGDFVCWLSGHTHYDLVSYDDRFPKQMFITISCAMPSSMFEEKIRSTGRGSGLVLNTVCVDTVRKYVKLLRYGAEWDDCLRHTGTCVIKYDANPPIVMFSN